MNPSGATIAKSFNRVGATFLAGSIGLGVHWMANQCGHQLEPLVLQLSIFIVGESLQDFLHDVNKKPMRNLYTYIRMCSFSSYFL